MTFYIQTLNREGERLGQSEIDAKRRDVKRKILDMGAQYVETEGVQGRVDAMGKRVEFRVYRIEAVSEVSFV